MRQKCIECVAKHVSNAQALLDEVVLGYPEFIHKVVGQLDQASSECLRYSLALANEIRELRLRLWDGWWLYRTGQILPAAFIDDYAPDLDSLLDRLDEIILEHELQGLAVPAVRGSRKVQKTRRGK